MGNRTQQVENSVTTAYTYNDANELILTVLDPDSAVPIETTYTWDARGNLTGKSFDIDETTTEVWIYTYDLANRLTEVVKDDVSLGSYAYDANGIRAKKVENGATTHYLALGHQVMYEKTGAEVTRHIFAGTQRIAEVRDGVTSFFHNDHLGSPRAVTDVNGAPGSLNRHHPLR